MLRSALLFLSVHLLSATQIVHSGGMFGKLHSPNYPNTYPDGSAKSWNIEVPYGFKVELILENFDLEYSSECDDYVKISANGKKPLVLCGGNNTDTFGDVIYTSFDNHMTVQFYSDFSNKYVHGFFAHYRAIDIHECEKQNAGCDHYCHNYIGGFHCSCHREFQLNFDLLSCVGKTGKLQCVAPTVPTYGSMTGDDLTINATLTFKCNDGYILDGSEARSCRADGSWSGEPTQCQIVDCNRPPSIPHGSWTSDSNNFTFTNVVRYICDMAYYKQLLQSESIRTCSAGGIWVPDDVPVCEQVCGRADVAPHPHSREKRIVGGIRTISGSWPWQVSMQITTNHQPQHHLCGGVLINDQWVMTTAQCFTQMPTRTVFILGTDQHNDKDRIEVYSERVIVHPGFDAITYDSDIALVKLNKSVQFSSVIRPICLPEQATDDGEEDEKPSGKGVIIGWGSDSELTSESYQFLREVYLPLVPLKSCRHAYQSVGLTVTENMVCASDQSGDKDACVGDSGGPFMFKNKNQAYYVYGLISWGNGCARPGYPGVYTRVTNYVNWIKNTVGTG